MPELPRMLVVDASILFSFFKSNSNRRSIVEELPALGSKLISPKFAFKELSGKKERIKKYGKINELAFSFIFSLLEKKVELFPEEVYREFLVEANKISPHAEDTDDDAYFALALALNSAIWSDETAFKQQSRIKVFNTKELSELIEFKKRSMQEDKDKSKSEDEEEPTDEDT